MRQQQQQRRGGTGSSLAAPGLTRASAADRITEGAMQLLYVAWQDLSESTQRGAGDDLDRALACVHDAIHDLREIAEDLQRRRISSVFAGVAHVSRGLQPVEVLAGPGKTPRSPYIARQTA